MRDRDSVKSPTEVYEAFQESMLSGTDSWKKLVGAQASFSTPLMGQVDGKAAFIEAHEAWFDTIEKQVLHKMIECEDAVIAQLSITVEAKNNQSITLEVAEWYTIREGKIRGVELFMDTAEWRKVNAVKSKKQYN